MSSNLPAQERLLRFSPRENPNILALGSYERPLGDSMVNLLPVASLTCVDSFMGPGTEKRFDANLREYAGRFEKNVAAKY